VKPLRHGARWLLYAAGAALALLATIVIVFALLSRRRAAELRPWHRIELTQEFHAGGDVRTFDEYRALEGRLLAQVRRELIDDPTRADSYALGRYNPKSIPGRLALETPFNASFELEPEGGTLRGAALLVHGLSDSPYSMRSVGRVLQEQGFYVLALRLPGHGTIPAGLLEVDWKDWYAAVELAAKHVAARAGADKPFYVGGYSTGAALTTIYSLRSLKDASLPR
jgi:predicted alpha/beta-fold hydrolase